MNSCTAMDRKRRVSESNAAYTDFLSTLLLFSPFYTPWGTCCLISLSFCKVLNIHWLSSPWLFPIESVDFSFSYSAKLVAAHSSAFQFTKLCCHLMSAFGSFPILSMKNFALQKEKKIISFCVFFVEGKGLRGWDKHVSNLPCLTAIDPLFLRYALSL